MSNVATLAKRREIERATLEQVVCDPAGRRIIALRPKLGLVFWFRQNKHLTECDGVFEVKI